MMSVVTEENITPTGDEGVGLVQREDSTVSAELEGDDDTLPLI